MAGSRGLEIRDSEHKRRAEGQPAGQRLAQVFGREHATGPAQDGVLGSVVGVLFGWDLQHGGDGALVGVQRVPHHLCDVLVDEDNADVIPVEKLPVGRRGKSPEQLWGPSLQQAPQPPTGR